MESVKQFFYRVPKFVYSYRDFFVLMLSALYMVGYIPEKDILLFVSLMCLFCMGMKYMHKVCSTTEITGRKRYVHEDEKGNLYIKVEDLNEVVEFVYNIERGGF